MKANEPLRGVKASDLTDDQLQEILERMADSKLYNSELDLPAYLAAWLSLRDKEAKKLLFGIARRLHALETITNKLQVETTKLEVETTRTNARIKMLEESIELLEKKKGDRVVRLK